jgi:hypothetical protein
MKYLIQILALFIAANLFGQNGSDTSSVLALKKIKHYKELNKFWLTNELIIRQEVAYNDPNRIDDEYSQVLEITIADTGVLGKQQNFDLVKDSAFIKCRYSRDSPWNWSTKNWRLVGKIKILSFCIKTIELAFDVVVSDNGKNFQIYRGMRKFARSTQRIGLK